MKKLIFIIAIMGLPLFGQSRFYQYDGTATLQNRSLTPGAVMTTDTAKFCKPGYSKTVRNVPESVKKAVFKEYGVKEDANHKYEVDHLISLELGGSNDIKNLWPQPYFLTLGAREKDKVENYLHRQVCSGKITIQEAQQQIRTDWYKVYIQMKKGR